MSGAVPSGTFKIHTINEATIFWLLRNFLRSNFIIDLSLKVKLIDGNNMLSGIILENTSKEGLWEEESRDPEYSWGTSFYPFLKENNSVV
jgi:hypothetical protein